MTLEELLECSADQLSALTDEQLMKHFAKYLVITRPELCVKPKAKQEQETRESFEKKQKVRQLAELGIDVSYLMKRKKK